MKRGRKAWMLPAGMERKERITSDVPDKYEVDLFVEGIFLTTQEHADEVREAEARGAGAMRDECVKLVDHSNDVDGGVDGMQLLGITGLDVTAYADKLRDEVLEEAAEVVDKDWALASPAERKEISRQIRALKRG